METANINTKEYWNINYRESGFYQDHIQPDWEFTHDFIKRALPSSPCRILEVACGLAHNAAFAAELGHNVVATDFSQIAIDEDKKRFANAKIRFECMSLEEATSIFKNFDVIMGFEIIEHYRFPINPIICIFKSLKEGGLFVFSVPCEGGRYAVWEQHYSIFNFKNLTELFLRVGFKKISFFKSEINKECIMGVCEK